MAGFLRPARRRQRRAFAENPSMRLWPLALALPALLIGGLWSSDVITLQGERTIYTADCRGGSWQGTRCSGRLVAADRYRFRALKTHREVVFWTAGASGHSGKFTDCEIEDGRNWNCKPTVDAAQTITLQMSRGVAMPDASGAAKRFHAIAKWRWWLLRWDIPSGNDAD